MKKLILLNAALMLACISIAQRGTTDRYGKVDVEPLYEDLMLPNSGGIFRGVSFDWSKNRVKELEEARSTVSIYKDEVAEELIVTSDMGDNILDFADITYKFDDQGLFSIKVESYATSHEAADGVYDKVLAFFQKKYGAGKMADDGFMEFKGTSGKHNFTVAVQNIDYEDSPGMYLYLYLD